MTTRQPLDADAHRRLMRVLGSANANEAVDRFAARVARFHLAQPAVAPEGVEGTAGEIWRWAHDNFVELRRHRQSPSESTRLEGLADWSRREFERLRVAFLTRRIQGHVRECHGDLDLGHVALSDDQPITSDGAALEEAARRIDVINDVAQPYIDFLDLGLPRLAARFLNQYLGLTGDHGGLDLLRFYAVYRALLKARVARIGADGDDVVAGSPAYARRIALAQALSLPSRPALLLMHGGTTSPRSVVSGLLAEELGAIRLGAEVERKRLFGAAVEDPDPCRRTYERLLLLAQEVVEAGYPVIVDATFAQRTDRAPFVELARRRRLRIAFVDCAASLDRLEPDEQQLAWSVDADADAGALAANCAAFAARFEN